MQQDGRRRSMPASSGCWSPAERRGQRTGRTCRPCAKSGSILSPMLRTVSVARKCMNPRIVKILHDAFKIALEDPAFIDAANKFSQEVHYMSSADYHDYAVKQFAEERLIADEFG